MKESKIKTCVKCKLGINIDDENFIELKEFNSGKLYKTLFWHKNCYREYISLTQNLKEMTNEIQSMMQGLEVVS
ncbi:hypothetical protein GF386_05435 [Candidatus Pacearchaeota archaeon]|nr:hypothetical protein [Candidatus Pacearchaeota archaeon]MBD3283533.1 hypothetical protein [Candidatus Pacearchaeota archaeon]